MTALEKDTLRDRSCAKADNRKSQELQQGELNMRLRVIANMNQRQKQLPEYGQVLLLLLALPEQTSSGVSKSPQPRAPSPRE